MVYYSFIMSNEQRARGGSKGRFRKSDSLIEYNRKKKEKTKAYAPQDTLTYDKILNTCIDYFHAPRSIMEFKKGKQKDKVQKYIIIYLTKELLNLPYYRMGKLLNANHTSIMIAHKCIKNLLDKDKQIMYDVKQIKDSLLNKIPKKRKDILHALKEVKGVDDTKDYVPKVWKNGFVGVKSYMRGNRLEYKLVIPKRIYAGFKDINEYRHKVFKGVSQVYEGKYEVESLYVQKQRDLFDKYFEDKSY